MSEFAIPRRAGLRRAWYLARRIGRALFRFLKAFLTGSGLGLGWCVAVLIGFFGIMMAAQPDYGYAWLHLPEFRHGHPIDPRVSISATRSVFIIVGLFGFLVAYQLGKVIESWWAKLWGKTP